MGTSYTIVKKGDFEFLIDEMSNVLDLTIATGDDMIEVEKLTPAEVVKAAMEMLKVASYWMKDKELTQAVREWRGGPSDYKTEVTELVAESLK